jgi:hypothetical protein
MKTSIMTVGGADEGAGTDRGATFGCGGDSGTLQRSTTTKAAAAGGGVSLFF